ncbi:retinol dehydrogenase 8-like isoform X2 [Asterias rubens]|nr:retinol dehydrogenase 8-like isoform X2 [Asterias rubens]
MRNLKSKANLEDAAGDTLNKTLFIRELDVTKETTITSVVDEILRENGSIDILVNNAGCCILDMIDKKSLDFGQSMMDVNYWGVVRTVRAVLPAMKKQKSGRILNVTSLAGFQGFPFYATYTSSKFAVEGFSESIASVLRDAYNIRVSLVEPGPVATPTALKVANDRPTFLESEAEMEKVFAIRAMYLSTLAHVVQTSEEIAQLHLEIILSDNPHLRYQTSEYVKEMAAAKFKDPTTDDVLNEVKRS